LRLREKDELEKYVKQGGGLLVIGGERNVYAEGKKQEDALDRTLPAKLAPPRSPEGTAVVLIIDKSSSMEGERSSWRGWRRLAWWIICGRSTWWRADFRQLVSMGGAVEEG